MKKHLTIKKLHRCCSKLSLMLTFAFCLFTLQSKAVIYTVGTGTTSNITSGITPFSVNYHDNRIQYIYLASELIAAGASPGSITSVAFNITAVGSPAPINVNIKIGSTTSSTLSTYLTGLTNSYSAATLNPVLGWNIYTLATPFSWNGVENIVIEVCRDNTTKGTNSNFGVQATNLGAGIRRTFGYYTDNVAGCTMVSGSMATTTDRENRPNIQFDITAAPACSGMPNAGQAVASVAGACTGQNFYLILNGTTLGSGLTYQWEQSVLGTTTWTPIANATNGMYAAVMGTSGMRYRCVVTCGTFSATSGIDTVDLNAFYRCYCFPGTGTVLNSYPYGYYGDNFITNVAIATTPLNNPTTATNFNGHELFDPSVPSNTAVLSIGQSYTLNVGRLYSFSTLGAWIDFNGDGVMDNTTELLSFSGNNATFTVPTNAVVGMTGLRVRTNTNAYTYGVNHGPCSDDEDGETEDYVITIVGATTAVTSVAVSTQGSVPSTIVTNGGTLQMQATVLPAAANQNVIWSIVPGTGTATISPTGLVTAQTNGTVWAKAVSVTNTAMKDSLMVTISNQTSAVTSVVVATQGSVPSTIVTNGGTLQMQATVLPAAANQNVTWSIVPGTGTATISPAGLVTAQTNGTVWAKAVSVANTSIKDSLMVTISNQTVAVASVVVATQGSVPSIIVTNGGTLQMQATVLPAAANQNVTWSIVPGTGSATISPTGLVTAQTNGTVWAKAVSVANPSIKDSLMVTISNQTVGVASVVVSTQGSVPSTITTSGGTLQMKATVLPAAANQNVTWSIVPGSGTASISATGLVTAQTNGTVWAKAVSVADITKFDSMQIVITGQTVGINDLSMSADDLKLYPNPANDVFTIENMSKYEIKKIAIVNILGQQIYERASVGKTTVIDVSGFAVGLYHVKIIFDQGEVIRKMTVKE